MDIDTLNHFCMESKLLNIVDLRLNFFFLPYFPNWFMMQCPDNSFNARDLFHLIQGNGIIIPSIPAKCNIHSTPPTLIKCNNGFSNQVRMFFNKRKSFLYLCKREGMSY